MLYPFEMFLRRVSVFVRDPKMIAHTVIPGPGKVCYAVFSIVLVLCVTVYAYGAESITIRDYHGATSFNDEQVVLVDKGDNASCAEPGYDDRSWRTVSFPFRTMPEGVFSSELNDVYWYRIHVLFPDALPDQAIGVSLGKIADVDQAYFNGQLIGSTGIFEDNTSHACNRQRIYQIPTSLIRTGKDNVLAVKVRNTYRADELPGRGEYYFGNYALMLRSYYCQGMKGLVFPLVYFVFFTYFLLLYYKRPKQLENLFYSITSLSFAIYSMTRSELKYELIDNFYFLQKLEFGSMFIAFAALMGFFVIYFKFRHRLIHWVFYGLTLIYIVGLLMLRNHETWYAINVGFIQYTWVIPLGSIFYILGKNFKRSIDARILMLSISFIILGIIHDTLLSRGTQVFSLVDFWLSPFAMFLFTAGIAVILSIRFANTMNEIEDLNTNLEEKVSLRTKELQNANLEIEAAMEELEAMNDNLVQTNHFLEDAKRAADRDMKMAIQVQTSFFPQKPVATAQWDTSFVFRPMSGVSGDFYDFYVADDKLQGVSLFDVSGHGIASGLLTMLARSIVFREFNAGRQDKLGVVARKINEQLINEIGSIDNYLTGMILRMNDDGSLDYINAGHTDLLIRRAAKNAVSTVDIRAKSFKGNFMGIEMLRDDYITLNFTPLPGDALLLYSDCLIESNNADGEEFGIERIKKIMNNLSADLSAQDILSQLVEALYQFTGKKTLQDDLTAIVLVRR